MLLDDSSGIDKKVNELSTIWWLYPPLAPEKWTYNRIFISILASAIQTVTGMI